MLPLLRLASDEKEHSINEAIEYICKEFGVTEEEKRELLPSGQQRVIDNRVGWARTYLKKAGLLESERRSYFRITPKGLEVLRENPPKVDVRFLERFPEFIEFRTRKIKESEEETAKTPQELLEEGYERLKADLAQQVLERVRKSPPEFFEKLVVDLLVKMGYGGSSRDAGKAIGKSGDEGIDGIIQEDILGLDAIYIQAKRWEGTVGRPEIQKFVGALHGRRAKKGIFITTSTFSNDARDYVSGIETKVVLIDGEKLAQLMIDNDVGVSTEAKYHVKKLDTDYFPE
jgi:restriction system protein